MGRGVAVVVVLCCRGPRRSELERATSSTADRYSIVHGCYALQSADTGKFVTKSGGAYTSPPAASAAAEPFRMQATALGRYLFYDTDERVHDRLRQCAQRSTPKPSDNAD